MVKCFDLARLQRGDAASLFGILPMLLSSLSKYISVSLYSIGKAIDSDLEFHQGYRMLSNVIIREREHRMDNN